MTVQEQRVHATCVAYGERGILITGASGMGKSDLALRMISQAIVLPRRVGSAQRAVTARLVADDQVILTRAAGRLTARAPAVLAGLIEIRGLGIVEIDSVAEVQVQLVAELVARDTVDRMPPTDQSRLLLGSAVRAIRVHAFDFSFGFGDGAGCVRFGGGCGC